MSFKTILSVVTDADLTGSALDAAIAVASGNDAHLDLLSLAVDRTQSGYFFAADAIVTQETLESARLEAAEISAAVSARMGPELVRWSQDEAVAQLVGISPIVGHRARFADLAVLPRPYGENGTMNNEAVVEAVLFQGRCPVMIMPDKADTAPVAGTAVIAWNESPEALSAIRAALPLLQAARAVNIAVIDPPHHGPDRSDPGGQLSQFLGRHGVRAEISVLAKTMPRISDVLARHIQDLNADLLVMGAYGHSRFREAIMGGATRDILETAPVPVFMKH